MRLLVLGGTNFLGPAIVERAIGRGHEVTLFNRGITRPHLFPEQERLHGERKINGGDLAALEGTRNWDAVIDVWPEQSELVRQTAGLLAERTNYYFFCSSIAVYRDFSRPGVDESAPTWIDEPGWYGGEKAIAESIVAEYFPGRSGSVRCHAILGPRDDGAAYHYWLRRLAVEDEVLAPGTGSDPVQFVDVRDVAAWVVDCCEQARAGVYNLCGPSPAPTLREFLEGSRRAIDSEAQLTWVDADFLRSEHGVRSFTDLPLWAPLDEDPGFYQIDGSKAVAAGAEFRPLPETARGAWRWFRSHFLKNTTFPRDGTGLSREREMELLEAWRGA
jgi:2'-hydroxyisoflavone reductase